MKSTDKEVLTYRPKIDYDIILSQSIRKRIHVNEEVIAEKQDELANNIQTYKTDVLNEFEKYNAVDVIKRINKLNDYKAELNDKLAEMNKVAKENGIAIDTTAYDIGSPVIGDSYVLMNEVIAEIDSIIALAEEILELGYTDDSYAKVLQSEYDRIQNAIAQETSNISFYTDYQLSDIERSYVDKLILDNGNDIKSYDDYVKSIIEEYRANGAAGVDYQKVRNDTKKSYALAYAMSLTERMARMAITSYDYNMSSVFDGDVDSALIYLVDIANRNKVKSMSELNYRKATRDAKVIKDNMSRINDIGFRSALNQHVIDMNKLSTEYLYDYKQDNLQGNDASVIFSSLNNSTKSMVDSNWDNVLVDRMTTSSTLAHQLSVLNQSILEQKQFSLMYRYSDIIDREFDFAHKEKEIDIFNSRHDVYSMR